MANIKISELNPLLTVEDADVLPIVDNGVTKKVTAAILQSYTQGNSVLLTGAQTVAGIKTFTSQLASSVATGTAPFSVASTTKVTNLNADLLDGLSSADFQATLSGTGIVKSTAGTISYLTDNTANWDTAYNDKINSAAVTGSGTNTLTLTQQDAGTITATWVNGTLIREVRNTTGATLTKGTIVYISGATGNKPTVTKAIASGDSTSAQTFGFIQSDLANNDNGYVVVVGDLTGVDTSAFAEGAQLYLSSTVAGTFTDVKQYAPAHLVYVGIVTRSHPTLGQIEVNIQNGYELDELHNVAAQNPSNGDILQFVTSTGLWTKVAGTTTNISEGTNLYFTNARSRSAFSESVTGLDYNSTTGVLSTTSGYGIPTTASQATWDTAYNDSIVSAAVTGTTTKTLTLNQQDGGTVTASWTDINTDAVSSVFGRTGAVVAASGDYTTTQVTEGTNLYFTDARARAAISLTTTGTSGAATYSGGVLNIPQYQAALTNPVTGTGTTNYLPKFTGTSALGNSLLQEGTNVIGFGTPNVWGGGANSLQINDGSIWGVSSLNGYVSIGGNYYYDSTYKYIKSSKATDYFQYDGEHVWRTAPSGTAGNAISFTQAMTLDASGRLGIGTSSPTRTLSVNGQIGLSDDLIATNSTNVSRFGYNAYYSSSGFNLTTENSIPLTFGTASAERMRITSSGNVGVGTTNPAAKLDVHSTIRITNSSSSIFSSSALELFSYNGSSVSVGTSLFSTNSNFNYGTIISNQTNLYGVRDGGIRIATGIAPIIFSNGNSDIDFAYERMRIAPTSGNVLIGTTTDGPYKLDVNGTARVSGAITTNSDVQLTNDAFIYSSAGAGSVGAGFLLDGTNSRVRTRVNDTYTADFNTTSFDVYTPATFSSSVTAGGNVSVGGTNQDSLLTINGSAGTSHARFREGSTTIGFIGGADGIISGQAGKLAIRGEAGLVLSGQGNSPDVIISNTGAATFSGQVNIGNPVAAAVAVASTHKVEIVIGGTTYYLLATT